ncbi:flavodoxin family protein [Clostridium beijerinckii]|jgi:multimeric flavodoxin WrbA|uniref:flavodoxin family protein n=1 Tax=Clostridium beijerinckii TaxID=1520 RepID=UPI00242A52AA|nr:flavodoxin family protein [Clostridium beijerinckii]MCI1581680.1 flavodoxin family protein [Clostridium beijerinckii]MCI1586236.1 flavodoxin family protein [Clostridium beijerinckii]MDG5854531.1 flavodoxin family protein [Clostridium beijerinckii]
MKVIAFVGSARKNGNTSKIVDAICSGIKKNGHEVETYNLSELDNKGCRACGLCQANKVEYCSINDKMTELLPKIADADCIIVGTPVYMVHVSGYTKNFLDRLFTFFVESNHTTRLLPGKKYITVTCSGAPAEAFKNVTEYLNQIFGGYSQMVNAGNIIAGNLHSKDDILSQQEMLNQAEEIGRKLN